MLLAAVNDDPYNVVYFFHIVTVIIGTGAAFVAPVMAARARGTGAEGPVEEGAAMLMSPALLLAGIFGGALVGLSDNSYDFGQTWLALGGLLWIVAVVAAALAYPPSFVNLPDMSARKPMLSGILHLSLAVMLVLMTWKFGV